MDNFTLATLLSVPYTRQISEGSQAIQIVRVVIVRVAVVVDIAKIVRVVGIRRTKPLSNAIRKSRSV